LYPINTSRKLFVFFLAIVLTSTALSGGVPESALERAVGDFFNDGKSLITSPLKWTSKDWTIALSFVGASSLTMMADKSSKNAFQRSRSDFTDRAADFFRPLGGRLPFWTFGGMYAYGWIAKDKKAINTAYLGIRSVVLTSWLVTGLKYSIGRARPFAGKGPFHFKGLDFSPSSFSLSLPSGHASTAFAFASVIAHQYPKWWVKLSVYALAAGVGWSRLNDNVHFLSDVVVGAGVGFFVGQKIVHRYQQEYLLDDM
jgi:membrane-associated phospholipid phosphatase